MVTDYIQKRIGESGISIKLLIVNLIFAAAVGAPKNGKKESKFRFDRRCGPNYPLSDGGPTQCNPTSKNYCCSKWGWCGAQGDTPGDNDTDHCTGGIDYRIKDE